MINDQPIKHVILIILENRSFDQILGYRSSKPYPFTVDGINLTKPHFNVGIDGTIYEQLPVKKFAGEDDCEHDLEETITGIGEKLDMSGFVKAQQSHKEILDPADRDSFPKGSKPCPPEEVMGYYPEGSLPVFDYLADNFLVCDRWFSSVPSATYCNKIFALTSDSKGEIFNACKIHRHLEYDQESIFERLNDAKIPYKVYWNDLPFCILLKKQRNPHNLSKYFHFSKFKDDVISGKLPYLSIVETEYTYESLNDRSSPYKHMTGERLVATVYDAVRSNNSVWESSIIFLYYDENGGFYDHVLPPKTVAPHDNFNSEGKYGAYPHWTFDRYGVRVPAMLISPWVAAGVCSQIYDHTSVLAYILRTLGLRHLTNRDAQANDFTNVLLESKREIPFKPLLPIFEEEARREYPIEATIRYHTNVQENGVITVMEHHLERLAIEVVSDIGKIEEKFLKLIHRKKK